MATGHSHVSLEIAGNWMSVVWPLSLTWHPVRDQKGEQLKLRVEYPDQDVVAAILTGWEGELWVAYPPHVPPPATIFVDGQELSQTEALIVPNRSYLLLNPDKTIEFFSTGVVPSVLHGERFPRTQIEDLADDDGDVEAAVAVLQGWGEPSDLTPLQAALLGRFKQMGWGN